MGIMETVTIPKDDYEKMKKELDRLRKLEKKESDVVRQLKGSLEDLKHGRFKRLA